MAGNYITIGSKFQPFTYEELVRPYQKYGEAYREQEAIYSDVMDKTGLVGGKINDQREAETYKKYMDYQTELQQSADALTKGLTMESRRNLMNVRKKYASEILPVAQLIEKRDQITEEQRKGAIADNSIMYDKDYSIMSLDEMVKNPVNSYRAVSGMELAKQASHEATSLARALITNPTYSTIVNGYLERGQMQGYTPEQVVAAIANDETAPQELKDIIDNVYLRSGVSQFDIASQEKAKSYIHKGIYDAIGQAKVEAVQDPNSISAIQQAELNMRQQQINISKQELALRDSAQNGVRVKQPDGSYKRIRPLGAGSMLVIDEKTGTSTIETPTGKNKTVSKSYNGVATDQNIQTLEQLKTGQIRSFAVENTGVFNHPGSQKITGEIYKADGTFKNINKVTPVKFDELSQTEKITVQNMYDQIGLNDDYFTIKRYNNKYLVIEPKVDVIGKELQKVNRFNQQSEIAPLDSTLGGDW